MARALARSRTLAPMATGLAAALLTARAVWPAPANAVDLFPVDDWVGEGIKKAGDVALGPLKLGVKEIAGLIAAFVGALADLLVPKDLVEAGLGGIKWLVQLPPVGVDATPQPGEAAVRMPHLQQLRNTLTWIGVTVMPLGIMITAGRAFLAPTAHGDSPADVVSRALTAGVLLLLYDWGWGVVTELSRLLTSGVLGLPWVADGVERMLETLLIGGGSGTAVAAEFVVPLMIMVAGAALLGLLLIRVGLEVATALLYVLGGLVLGLSVTSLGRRLLSAWLVAAAALVALPLLWSTVFAVGAALMLDAGDTAGRGDFWDFVAQFYNVGAALAVFWISIKLARGVFRHASGAITGITAAPAAGTGGGAAAGTARVARLAQNATPAGLVRFSQGLRGAVRAGASYPFRHPVPTAHAVGAPLRLDAQTAAAQLDRSAQATRAVAKRVQRGVTDYVRSTDAEVLRRPRRDEWTPTRPVDGRVGRELDRRRAAAAEARVPGGGGRPDPRQARGSGGPPRGRGASPPPTPGGPQSESRVSRGDDRTAGSPPRAGGAGAPPGAQWPSGPRSVGGSGGASRAARPLWVRWPRKSDGRDGKEKR